MRISPRSTLQSTLGTTLRKVLDDYLNHIHVPPLTNTHEGGLTKISYSLHQYVWIRDDFLPIDPAERSFNIELCKANRLKKVVLEGIYATRDRSGEICDDEWEIMFTDPDDLETFSQRGNLLELSLLFSIRSYDY